MHISIATFSMVTVAMAIIALAPRDQGAHGNVLWNAFVVNKLLICR